MSNFIKAVERNLRGLEPVAAGPSPGCGDCLPCDHPDDPSDDWRDLASEPSFSRSRCDGCGSTFAGSRYPAHGYMQDRGEWLHLDVCTDCYLYLANGDTPEDWKPRPPHR